MRTKIVSASFLVLLAGVLLAALYFFVQLTAVQRNYAVLQRTYDEAKKNPQKLAQAETQQLLERVGRLIVLPEGEQPIVATVSDPEKLKNQQFFSKAKTGDKVLIYTNAKKAILYDPVSDRIIEVAPVNIGGAQQ